MSNEELLAALNQRFDKLDADVAELKTDVADLKTRVGRLEKNVADLTERVEELAESQEEIRGATNALLEWAENVSESYKFPLPKIG